MARKVKYDFNPLKGLRGENRQRAASEIKQYVQREVIERMNNGQSPVSGQRAYKQLTSNYAKAKKGGNRDPNLRLEGDLQSSVTVQDAPGGRGLRLTVSDGQQPKADGHNNFTGRSQLPRRAFVPDARREEKFKRDMEREIQNIANKHKSQNGNNNG